VTNMQEYLAEIARRKEESRSIKATMKYLLGAIVSLITMFLGLVPVFTLPGRESAFWLVPGLLLSLISLAALLTSAFSSVTRFRAWYSARFHN
jgi:hypothetical protein